MNNLAIADEPTPLACEETAQPLWRCVVDAFNARRQREADRLILRSLCHSGSRIDDGFRLEFERRLVGQ
jgi:hypothetical protein